MKLNKYSLFGIVPLLYREEYTNEIEWKLFKFIPIVQLKRKDFKTYIKILGIPLIKNTEKYYCSVWTYKTLRFLASLNTKRNIVLITDNIREPNSNIVDNFTYFEYLYNKEDKTLDPYYIIHKQSPYYKELKKKYGKHIIEFDNKPTISTKFKLISIMAHLKFACDSFNALEALQLNFNKVMKKSPYMFSIFTQHGINYFKPDFVRPNVFGYEMHDYCTISNDKEKKIMVERGTFPESRTIKNGLFRWDKLSNEAEKAQNKSIFVFFTKRAYVNRIKDVANCVYVKSIKQILTNEKLQKVLAEHNIKLKVGIHHSVVQSINDILRNQNIVILEEDDIAQIKKEASMLITDYSSMSFEFFYQHKPVVFYSIDDSMDCKLYGGKEDMPVPYTGKENDLFNITKTDTELINKVIHYIENDFKCEPEVIEKEDKFFYYKDGFCKRMEEFMINHINDKK